jgi:hypothetical protein
MAKLTTEPTAFAARIFFNGQGVEVHEPYKNRDGETKHRRYTFWFTDAVAFDLGATGVFAGDHSTKIDNWTNPDGSPKLDQSGKQGQSVVVQGNNATFTPANPVAAKTAPTIPVDVTPF